MRNLKFYVYNIFPQEHVRRTWTTLSAYAKLPMLLSSAPKTKGGDEARATTSYAYMTRIHESSVRRRVQAVCYSFVMDDKLLERAASFFGAIAKASHLGVRFVIRDNITRHWFEAQLRDQDPEVAARVRSVMGNGALPEGYKWVRGLGSPQRKAALAGLGPSPDTCE